MPPKKRLTANPTAPLRYRPGKAVGNVSESSSSESDSGAEDEQQQTRRTPPPSRPPPATSFPKFNTQEAEARKRAAAAAALDASNSKTSAPGADDGFVTASESSDAEGESSDGRGERDIESSDGEDSDSSSSEEDTQPRFVAPTFISKAQRNKASSASSKNTTSTSRLNDTDDDKLAEARHRQAKTDELLEAQIKRETLARARGKKAFDDDEDENNENEVNDKDGLDPEAEYAAWRLRELTRLKRDRDALIAADRAREELERYRDMSDSEKARLDEEKLAAQKEEKARKGQAGFMQRYHHKGAFFQQDGEDDNGNGQIDPEEKRMLDELRKRDLMGAKFQDDSAREILPQYMQIRDMTKLGRKGRTKYKDLRAEDTGTWGDDRRRDRDGQYDRGDRGVGGSNGNYRGRADDGGPTGANSYAVGERRQRGTADGADDRRAEKRSRYD